MRRGTTLNDLMQWDNTLFDGITLNAEIDHDTLVSTIMFQCGLQECAYQDYDVFKAQVHTWFNAMSWNFNRLIRLINETYNPLWNKDGKEVRTVTTTFTGQENEVIDTDVANTGTTTNQGTESIDRGLTLGGTDSEVTQYNSTLTDAETETTDTIGQNIHSVKGFNATDWQETDKDNSTENRSNIKNGTENKTGTDTVNTNYGKTEDETTGIDKTNTETLNTNQATDTNRDRSEQNLTEVVDEFITTGNIGVTTSQAMFQEELALLGGFNLYQWIARKFDNDLMLGVYV